MPGDAAVENGPPPDEKFTSLMAAVRKQGDGERPIPMGRRHIRIEITPPYMDIIQYYLDSQYHQIKPSILDPKVHYFLMQGAFLH
ncbi:hypothetical protein VC83_03389 [Pseudogymnoascus destructans]|uniref:Uncharacterized protein n=1 Tax=Pseudogymnoascus destructans TaxID=655981 RepID=A0A177AG99_9PEZI|nr:uncharacterized protein VC83_03389 [Pseudogymnoascus destructans]OAF60432.1 hypothetical protein VC83_03389 [Pseudogymnoascus destructans]